MKKLSILLLFLIASGCQFKAKEETAGLIADHVPTTNNFVVSVPSSSSYKSGDNLNFNLAFPYPVSVTGFPRIQLDIGGNTVYAIYISGNGSTNLIFSYTVTGGDNDSNGISVTSSIDLNGGSLTFTGTAGPDNCNTSLIMPSTSSVLVDTTSPFVSTITPPSPGTYYEGQNLAFYLTMNETSIVTGTPRIQLTIGGSTRYANYVSGSGSSILTFRYVVTNTDIDNDGIVSVSPIDLNNGTLKDSAGNDATLTFATPNTTTVIVLGATPYITSISSPSSATYVSADILDFTVRFNKIVDITGSPNLELVIGATTQTATYLSGTGTSDILFRYQVKPVDNDSDGIVINSPVLLNGGTIRSTTLANANLVFTVPNTSGILISNPNPAILSIDPPINGIYKNGTPMSFTLNFTENVNVTGAPRVALQVNSSTVYADYSSGSGTSALVFIYDPGTGHIDLDGINFSSTTLDLNSGTIQNGLAFDADLNYPTLPSLSGVLVVYPSFQQWYDFNDPSLISTTFSGCDLVDLVTDKLASGRNLSASGAARPCYNSSGFGGGNTGYIQFDGTNDLLNFSSNPTIKSMIVVFESHSNTATTTSLFNATSGGAGGQIKMELASGGNYNITATGAFKENGNSFSGNSTSFSWPWSASTNYVLATRWTTARTKVCTIGNVNFDGKIAEIIVLNDTSSPLSDADYETIRTFLEIKHDVVP